MKQNKSVISESDKLFWEREAKANFARKRDISALDYFSPDPSRLPFADEMDETEAERVAEVKNYSSGKMMNLSGYSNTDLKEMYGAANLDELSEYDQRFQLFLRALSEWANYLFEKKEYVRAKTIYEYAIEIGSDISTVYINLGILYAKAGKTSKVDELITLVENSDFALKDSIIKKLRLSKLEY
ncbi:MAG: hypothetical protein IJ733_14400 [Lachnospiraceae bacterium]|nr:hypothetical protein [Lachnospiraceae bacterium]